MQNPTRQVGRRGRGGWEGGREGRKECKWEESQRKTLRRGRRRNREGERKREKEREGEREAALLEERKGRETKKNRVDRGICGGKAERKGRGLEGSSHTCHIPFI